MILRRNSGWGCQDRDKAESKTPKTQCAAVMEGHLPARPFELKILKELERTQEVFTMAVGAI